jgi:thiamine biosynthesis lipoprotein
MTGQRPAWVEVAGSYPRGAFLFFQRDAMATTFGVIVPTAELELISCDERYVTQAAEEAFAELERLEGELSRFRETSDVAQLARLRPRQSLILGFPAFDCLVLASRINDETRGAFDVALGRLTDSWQAGARRGKEPTPDELAWDKARSGQRLLLIVDEGHEVIVKKAGVVVDLGGIGKGYALDRMAVLLRVWGISDVLLHSGQSTVLAFGSPSPNAKSGEERAGGWPVALRDPRLPRPGSRPRRAVGEVRLTCCAVSGSAQSGRGPHIIDPRTGRPAANLAAWAMAPTAAEADALSTAFMVMSAAQVRAFCRRRPEVSALVAMRGAGEAKNDVVSWETFRSQRSSCPSCSSW